MIEEIGVETWNEMRERNAGERMEYLLGLCAERQRSDRVIEGVKDFLESAWRERMRKTERREPLRDGDGGDNVHGLLAGEGGGRGAV